MTFISVYILVAKFADEFAERLKPLRAACVAAQEMLRDPVRQKKLAKEDYETSRSYNLAFRGALNLTEMVIGGQGWMKVENKLEVKKQAKKVLEDGKKEADEFDKATAEYKAAHVQ
jgi:hypothetical protein